MITLNMIGKPCPIPVVEAKKAMSQPGAKEVTVLVDNAVAVQNLEKMAAGMGYGFSSERKGEAEFSVTITAGEIQAAVSSPGSCASLPAENSGGLVVLLTGDQIGIGEAEPAQKLMKNFLLSLTQLPPPSVIILLNQGVKLAAEGAQTLEDLRDIAGKGTEILACGQCLAYYGLTEKLAAGRISNMLEIAGILGSAARVLTL